MSLTLLPAVDVVGGKAVRLERGVAGTEKSYGDPLESALRWQEAGATWLHFVDLDAAFSRGSNAELMAQVIGKLDIDVELAGGIRDSESLERALATGATRVNIGTAAFSRPDWIADVLARYGERVAVDIAVEGKDGQWRTRTQGWVDDAGDLWEELERLDAAGCQRFVVTDVAQDGMLTGPNVDLLRDISAATDARITASGGIATLDDVDTLAGLVDEGIDAAIIGKALFEDTLSLKDALQHARGEGS
ncbi:phosphoribosyl isomerase [Corynebacterium atypicum]|uniref:1-(5-phosphoribosyl)-5-[(5-phosphoribosylamino)methylideneamino] imidazole-4-carboxamide isomerase n=1 Tax=Corynebacterium atypicum TaxID=191610 RepID=A0ABM5QNP9_9CORY|nr:bifunctional 1-(5-phosphoribosyl)-5-((5-phosphoribosylamino)methylideneamino)imidazole-4-carboxamide isomerase/phosphoribosylanthranilate isomerase PriA [Corynebacterium atypicum]AIG64394.1 phosphoribosyl isomerase [Corynebacterium atypicum]